MAEETFLSDDFLRQLINVGEVDILVGLPTHNNARTVGSIVQAIQTGLLQWFPRERAVIINPDGGSHDGTPDQVRSVSIDDARPTSTLKALRTLHSISTQYAGSPANGPAFRTILAAAELLRAKACVMMSPEAANTEPEWLPKLLRPVYRDDFDLVTPTYRRHKFEGLLISNLLYPMTRALYGLRVREAYATEFGFSGRYGCQFLAQNAWDDATGGTGAELRFAVSAIAGRRRICQSFLGDKEHVERNTADLVPALRQTAGTLFAGLEPDFGMWSAVIGSEPIPSTGSDSQVLLDAVRINRKRLRDAFAIGVAELESVFQSILSPPTLVELQRISRLGEDDFNYPAELWVKTVYEFAAAYQKSVISRDHIIQALAPLFRGRAVTFLMENHDASSDKVESNIEDLCLVFERLKPYLLQMWKTGE